MQLVHKNVVSLVGTFIEENKKALCGAVENTYRSTFKPYIDGPLFAFR